MTYPFYRNRRIISAAVPQNCVWMTGEGFKATLTGEKEVYLFRLCTDVETDTSAGDVETPYYEMYMAKRVSYEEMPWESSELSGNAHGECMTQQIFDTLRGGYVLEDAVKELYGAVEQAAYDLKIDTNVRSTIMDFLNDSNLGTEAAK